MAASELHVFPPIFASRECRYGRYLYPRGDRYLGRSLAIYGEFSEGEAELFRRLVEPGQVVVEAGANIGAHTVLFSRIVGPAGLVLAFEPQRILHQVLNANLALNHLTNVVTEQAGLGRVPGTAFVPPLDYGADLSFGGLSLEAAGEGEAVAVRTLDAYGLQACAFVKIDVEGMEAQVLEGGIDTIRRLRPLLYVENDRRDRSPALIALLRSMGYRLWWHTPPLFNAANFAGNPVDEFPGILSQNILAVPMEREVDVEGLREVAGPGDWCLGS